MCFVFYKVLMKPYTKYLKKVKKKVEQCPRLFMHPWVFSVFIADFGHVLVN